MIVAASGSERSTRSRTLEPQDEITFSLVHQYADVRVFLQIWDSRDGSIAWEAMQELRISLDSTRDEPVMLRELLKKSAHDLISRLP